MTYIAPVFASSQSAIGLAATYHAQGEYEKAYDTAVQGWQRYRESGNPVMAARAEGYLAYLGFRQQGKSDALRFVSHPSRIASHNPIIMFHAPLVGRAAILFGEASPGSYEEAAELLPELRASVERHHNTRFLIEVLAMQALLLSTSGDMEGALKLLERAVQLTIPGKAIRSLADHDFQIGALFDELAKHSPNRSQILLIRRAALVISPAMHHENGAAETAARKPEPVFDISNGRHPDLLESLTHREYDVLILLLERPSNKEIAAHLSISTETVKRHLVNIFRKLHVENRRQAIVQARAMGVLPPA
jgi:ATP/maltotriose-dependent transcriptional regulator MalT